MPTDTALPPRLRKLLDHLDRCQQPPRLAALARLAGCSPFHLHRQFLRHLGLSPAHYLQLQRLHRAAWRLAFRREPVLEIALDAGYESGEAFARAFRRLGGQSPSQFRQCPDWPRWQQRLQPLHRSQEQTMPDPADEVTVVERDAVRIGLLLHRGDPLELPHSLSRFIAWRRSVGLPPARSATYNLLYDDPEQVAPADYRFGLAAAVPTAVEPNPFGVVEALIEGGRWARLRHVGSDDALGARLRWLLQQWLPQSGERLREAPILLQRLRFFPDVPAPQAQTDILLPLR